MPNHPPHLEPWKQLLRASQNYRAAAPWQWMYDSPVVGIEDPQTGEMGYSSVMGAAGEQFGLVVFRGATGFWGYTRFLEFDMSSPLEQQVTMRHMHTLNFTLGGRDEVDDATRKMYRELGYAFRGKTDWPTFDTWLPGYDAWPLEGDEVGLMARYLEVTTAFATRIRDDQDLRATFETGSEPTDSEDGAQNVLCLIPTDDPDAPITTPYGGFVLEWRVVVPESPVRIDALYDANLATRLLNRSDRSEAVWEYDVVATPMRIGDSKARAATVEMALGVDVDSGVILGFDMSVGDEPSRPAVALLNLIDQAGYIPMAVVVCRKDVYESLKPLAEQLGIELWHRSEAPSLEDAYLSLVASLG